ncbi:zinc-binding alcohol dehydrogenase family protein [Niveispirillum sp. BGYR6]|uniref:zinc-binding alcohol dehydrogenase family protein n=1 Tax=Niveispirillum sp. BGYR6 TaxID=2971249 RepID=UPI0022B99A18|nr:zinc-binding alcohol dehydrogenase family protein [Niveispirillum sp. BGYR6]MDG5496276.1 zinc-binding alcohol dehydrogenase family protein [Niveispirillum sp. BGYR6]
MKAIRFRSHSRSDDCSPFIEVEVPRPVPSPHDLLVSVKAVSVNPVDTKVRSGVVPVPDTVDVLGWDAAGTVVAVGTNVQLFRPGQDVFYAGTFTRSGANVDLHLVDERMVGFKPSSLSFAQAAALPLTSLTAWQLLFDRLAVPIGKPVNAGSLLVVGGAGGVGSILIQLARRLTGLTVIATASRPETSDWCKQMGAHHVIDHTRHMPQQIAGLSVPPVSYVASLTHTAKHMSALVDIVAPHGKIGVIDDHDQLDAVPLKSKSISLHWEMVFTRAFYETADLIGQHQILNEVAALVDAGILRSTLTRCLTPFSPLKLMEAHRLVESGAMIGKVVMSRDDEPAANSTSPCKASSAPFSTGSNALENTAIAPIPTPPHRDCRLRSERGPAPG